MSKTASIFQALNESRDTDVKKKKKNENVDPVVDQEEKVGGKCECGEEYGDTAKFCPNCGSKIDLLKDVSEEEDDPEEEEVFVIEDEEEEDPEEIDLSTEGEVDPEEELDEEDDDIIEISEYNEDTLKALGSILKSAKAPVPIMKAYESKMYERCTFWLESKKGISIDLSEGFTKNESVRIKKYLESIKAPKLICEAFERGQHSLVAAYLKTRK